MSETALAREHLFQYIQGDIILDLGFGGTACHPKALTFDMPVGYCPSLEGHKQILQGDCRNLSFICDGAIDCLWSSHLIEDFTFAEQEVILREWRRVLKVGGTLITVAPDQQVYAAHCAKTGQPYNEAHRENSMGLSTFNEVVHRVGAWETLHQNPLIDTYSFHSVLKKI